MTPRSGSWSPGRSRRGSSVDHRKGGPSYKLHWASSPTWSAASWCSTRRASSASPPWPASSARRRSPRGSSCPATRSRRCWRPSSRAACTRPTRVWSAAGAVSGRPRLSTGCSTPPPRPDPAAAVLDATARRPARAPHSPGRRGATRSVVRSAASWSHSFPHVSALLSVGHDAGWVPGPLSSTMNLFAAVHAAWAGATVVSDPRDATHAHLTPSALARCLDDGRHSPGCTSWSPATASPWVARPGGGGRRPDQPLLRCRGASFVAWGSHEDDLHPFPEVDVVDREGSAVGPPPYLADGYEGEPGARCATPMGTRRSVTGGTWRAAWSGCSGAARTRSPRAA